MAKAMLTELKPIGSLGLEAQHESVGLTAGTLTVQLKQYAVGK